MAKPTRSKTKVNSLSAKSKVPRPQPKKIAPAKAKAAANTAKKPRARPSSETSTNTALAAGARAPAFELANEAGKSVTSRNLSGKPYVLYFYPKDDTPGCTAEACGFRDSLNRFSKRGVTVLGVSPDSNESHARFKSKYGLNFPLLSDPDKKLAKAYGVWVKKQNYGREYMGVERSTFLVDANGVIRHAWRRVRVPGHVDAVFAALQS